eukprot:5218221-Karenia_brevis.AAC.1
MVTPVFQEYANTAQRGFIRGRDFVSNILEVDTWSRIWASTRPPSLSGHPGVQAFFDFSTAFPSISFAWLLSVLQSYGAPVGVC